MKFKGKLQLVGKTATGIHVPPEVVEALGAGKRPPVYVEINGHKWRSTVAPYGGVFFLGVSALNREGAEIRAGEEIEVYLQLDRDPREVDVPEDLAGALAGNPAALEAFNALSFSNKMEHVQSVNGAKTQETRERRIANAVSKLQTESARK